MPKVKTRSRQSERAIPKKKSTDSVEKSVAAAAAAPSKDQKRKERHKAWLDKLDAKYTSKKRKRGKNELNADLSEFNEILDTITTATGDNAEKKKKVAVPVVSSAKLRTNKSKKRAEMQEIVRMQKVMNLSAFKENPLAAIRQHVQNTFGTEA